MKIDITSLNQVLETIIVSEDSNLIRRDEILNISELNENDDAYGGWDIDFDEKEKVIQPSKDSPVPVDNFTKVAQNQVTKRIEREWSIRVFSFDRPAPGRLDYMTVGPGVYSKSVADFADPKDGRHWKRFFKEYESLRGTEPEKFEIYKDGLWQAVKAADGPAIAKIVSTVMAGDAVAIAALTGTIFAKLSVVLVALGTFLIAYEAVEDIRRNILISEFKEYKKSLISIFKMFPSNTLKIVNDKDKFIKALESIRANMASYANNPEYMKPEWSGRARKDISNPAKLNGFIDIVKKRALIYFDQNELKKESKMLKLTATQIRQIIKEELFKLSEDKGTGDVAYPGDLGIGTGTGSTDDEKSGEETDIDSEIEATTSQLQSLRSKGTDPSVSPQKTQLQRQLAMLQQKKSNLASE